MELVSIPDCHSSPVVKPAGLLGGVILLDECFNGLDSGASHSMGHLGLSYEIADVKGRITHPSFLEVYYGRQIWRDDDVPWMVVSMNGFPRGGLEGFLGVD